MDQGRKSRRSQRRALAWLLTTVVFLALAGCGHVGKKLKGDTSMGLEWIQEMEILGTWPLEKAAITCHGGDKVYLRHAYEKVYWPGEPTCLGGGTYQMTCVRCGYLGKAGEEEALPHVPVGREEVHGDCMHPTVEVTSCEVCGMELGRNSYFVEEHDYQESFGQVFDTVTLQWEQKGCMKCRRCGTLQSNIPSQSKAH